MALTLIQTYLVEMLNQQKFKMIHYQTEFNNNILIGEKGEDVIFKITPKNIHKYLSTKQKQGYIPGFRQEPIDCVEGIFLTLELD